MARTAKIQCELKKQRLEKKHRERSKRIADELDVCYALLVNDPKADVDAIYERIEALQTERAKKIPNNGRQVRRRNRCALTGRSRGYYRKFKLSRSMLRKFAMMGLVPGITKASW